LPQEPADHLVSSFCPANPQGEPGIFLSATMIRLNLETSVEFGFFSMKPHGYWRDADFPIHLSGEVENAVGGSACGPIPQRSRRKRTLLQHHQLPDLG